MCSYRYLGRDYDYFDAFDLINESNHCSEIFDEMINDIVKNMGSYINQEKATGWYYNMQDYNVNRQQIGVKLKIIIEDLSKQNLNGYIDPNRFPEIVIHLDTRLLNNIPKFKATLLHELTHVIKVYIKNRNGLTTVKETLLDELNLYQEEFDLQYKDKNTSNKLHDFLYTIFYVLSLNEQLASINETCKFLKECNIKDIQAFLKKMFN